MKTIKHCKKEYSILVNYSEITNLEIIEFNGIVYEILRNPRPTTTEAQLICVFVNGIKYSTFAKFLKTIK